MPPWTDACGAWWALAIGAGPVAEEHAPGLTATYLTRHIYVVKRTTVFLDDGLIRRAMQRARAEGRSFAALVREAVAVYVDVRPAGRRPLPSFTGIADSGETDIAERVDEFLWTDPHG